MSREECVEVYKERIRESWLVPGDMNARDAASRFRPVYIPFWCLSGEGDGPSVRQYTVPTTEGTNTVREDTYEEKLTGSISVGDIHYDACSQFDDETAQWLQFSDKDTVPFHPAYLSGFYAEAPDVDSKYFDGLARDYALQCAGQMSRTLPANFKEHAELVLMPVWMLASRQGEKVVYTAVRGTAEGKQIRCELPVSPKRFAVLICVLAALITALALYMHHFVLLRPPITAALSCILAVLCWNIAAPFLEKVNSRSSGDDPTRNMLGGPNDRKSISKYLDLSKWSGKISDRRYALGPKELRKPLLIIALVVLAYLLFANNKLRAYNSLIADGSVLPAALGILSFCFLYSIRSRCPAVGKAVRAALLVQMGICLMMAVMLLFPSQKNIYYIISLISFLMTLLVLINAFRQHNVYVTRPVPFFDRKEGER